MINTSIKTLKGVGEKKALLYAKLGIHTLFDLVHNYPKKYNDMSKVTSIEDTVFGTSFTVLTSVSSISSNRTARGKEMVKVVLYDDSGEMEAIYINAPYIKNILKKDVLYYFHGTLVDASHNKVVFHPEFVKYLDSPKGFGIRPTYSLTKGLKSSDFTKLFTQISSIVSTIDDRLPKSIVEKYQFMSRKEAIVEVHLPTSMDRLEEARRLLIYEELFFHQFLLLASKEMIERQEKTFNYLDVDKSELSTLFSFDFTSSQEQVIDEVYADMKSKKIMNRLLHGDVGSGKTAIAISAAYLAVKSSYQVAVMAPTEILAKQHFETFQSAFGNTVNIRLLVSKSKDKKTLYSQIKDGSVDIIIGTHAIIQKDVSYNNLRLIITDEQHRFGVRQRSMLKDRVNGDVDTLVMSATPIPRTLSMIVYGDLDVSKLDVMPIGRKEIITKYVKNSEKWDLVNFCKERIDEGEKVYFVAPLIEDNEESSLTSLDQMYTSLTRSFKGYRVGKLHGKMKPEEKEQVISDFKSGKIQVLASTTVIEVGVDVREATIMVITHVERFGLSQLHQLRGRVGRNDMQSYCFLTSGSYEDKVKKRIDAMVEFSSGFDIAEIDLKLRGPGDILGTRQHGFSEFKIADYARDYDIVQAVREDVRTYARDLSDENLERAVKSVLSTLKY